MILKLFYTVCPNGQGHVKRSVAVAKELVRQRPELQITWFVSANAKQYIWKYASTELLSASTVFEFNEEGSISLLNANKPSFWINYSIWREQMFAIRGFKEADLVVSDNIAAPLEQRTKTILTGSFLWSEILENTADNERVIEHERKCLKAHPPNMLHQAGFGMPHLNQYTNPVSIPWFTNKAERLSPASKKVLITAGKSGDNIEPFVQLVEELLEKGERSFFVDETLHKALDNPSIKKFPFTSEAFSSLGCIICRPGMGIITEAVKYEVPLLTFSNFDNPELEFNANQIEDLGLGLMNSDISAVISAMNDLRNSGENRNKILVNLKNQRVGGATYAAGFILDTLIQ